MKSSGNADIVRRSFDHFRRHGYLPEELWDSDGELTNVRESPLPGPYRGYEGLRQWRDDLVEVLDYAWFDVEDTTEVSETGAVLTQLRLRGRAKYTGIEVDFPFFVVVSFRDGRIHRSRGFSDRAEAGEAAGLSK